MKSLNRLLGIGLFSLPFIVLNANAANKTIEERKKAGEVYVNPGDEPPSMDPTKQSDSVSSFWLGHIYEGLMTRNAKGEYVPGTAEKMIVSSDNKKYTFIIRKDAKWQDGKAVTAYDFEYAAKRLVNPEYASEYSFIAKTLNIVNADEIISKKEIDLNKLGVKALNDQTLEVTIKYPCVFLPSVMSFNVFYPVRKDIVEKYGDKIATSVESIIGNGPFKLVSWVKDASMRIEKSDTYWNKKDIKLNAIEAAQQIKDFAVMYNMFVANTLDIALLDKDRVIQAQKDKKQIKYYNEGTNWWFELNLRKGKVFENINLRKAVKYGINRNEYINKIEGIPGSKSIFGLIPDYLPGSLPGSTYRKEFPMSWKDNDTTTAKKYIQKYLTETKQVKVPSFTILVGDDSISKMRGEWIQSLLSKLFGTEIKLETVQFKTRIQKMRDADFDLVVAGWGPDYNDVMSFADLYTSTNENNHSGFKNAEVDKYIELANKEPNAKKRLEYVYKAEKIVIEDEAVLAPFSQRTKAYLIQSGLNGVIRKPLGSDPDLRYANWDK